MYRLLPSAPSPPDWSKAQLPLQQKVTLASQSEPSCQVDIEGLEQSDDRALWPQDPARSLCRIQ